jgi:uncharacterized repeat protein (TIGR03803 family)
MVAATNLTLGPDGRLYGTTLAAGQFNRGTVFAIDPASGALADQMTRKLAESNQGRLAHMQFPEIGKIQPRRHWRRA